MKKLFLSYSALLKLVADGSVTQADLDGGLYYFGCGRDQVFAPWTEDAPKRVMAAVEKAEREGRVAWRPRFGTNNYQDLGVLLLMNGFDAVSTVRYDRFDLPTVTEALKAASLPIEAIGR